MHGPTCHPSSSTSSHAFALPQMAGMSSSGCHATHASTRRSGRQRTWLEPVRPRNLTVPSPPAPTRHTADAILTTAHAIPTVPRLSSAIARSCTATVAPAPYRSPSTASRLDSFLIRRPHSPSPSHYTFFFLRPDQNRSEPSE